MHLALALALVLVAVLIAAHHWLIHPNLSGVSRFFQVSDVSNHETWVVACLAAAATAVAL